LQEASTSLLHNITQLEGFCRFINQDLAEELEKFLTIKDPDHEIASQLFVKGYQSEEPRGSSLLTKGK
jgi:DNA-directed RNA polymerase subunit beta